MNTYQKPEVEIVDFSSEEIADSNLGNISGAGDGDL